MRSILMALALAGTCLFPVGAASAHPSADMTLGQVQRFCRTANGCPASYAGPVPETNGDRRLNYNALLFVAADYSEFVLPAGWWADTDHGTVRGLLCVSTGEQVSIRRATCNC